MTNSYNNHSCYEGVGTTNNDNTLSSHTFTSLKGYIQGVSKERGISVSGVFWDV